MTEHTTSYYAASANKYAPFPTLSESISCDVCVVGGGYTGLSSALHLAEMGYDVVLLESARIGFGASWLTPIAAILTSLKKPTDRTRQECSAA